MSQNTGTCFANKNYWGVILGGSSGFGLASAKELARKGMNICVVHRDRKGSMERIEKHFDEIRATGVKFVTYNVDALSKEVRESVLKEFATVLGEGRIRTLLHSIAFGSLKIIAPQRVPKNDPVALLAEKLGIPAAKLQESVDQLFTAEVDGLHTLATKARYENDLLLEEEEALATVHAMGVSLLGWTRAIFDRKLFAPDARVLGLTSEGNEVAWPAYAAVSAAKASLEAISRSIATEFGPHGIRSNILQPGVTDTPALRLIPGSMHLMAQAKLKNPLGRLTQVTDVARLVGLMSTDEAAWINGSLIRVDGGEHISGL